MRDKPISVCSLYQKGENCVSEKERKLFCTILPTMILYSKDINVKIAKAHMNYMLLSYGLRTRNSVISSDKVNDKRKTDKFNNYILYTQRET